MGAKVNDMNRLEYLKDFRRKLVKARDETEERMRDFPFYWPNLFTRISYIMCDTESAWKASNPELWKWLDDLQKPDWSTHIPALFDNSIRALDEEIARLT